MQASQSGIPEFENLLKDKAQNLYHLQQDLIKKVVPTVVEILKNSIAKDLIFVEGIKSGYSISVNSDKIEEIKNALRSFICLGCPV